MFVKHLYSQRDLRWFWHRIGKSWAIIGNKGCLITCLAMIRKHSPLWINKMLKENNGYDGALLKWGALSTLGLKYNGLTNKRPDVPCIAKVLTKNNKEHFIILYPNNNQVDPWTGKRGRLSYWLSGTYFLIT